MEFVLSFLITVLDVIKYAIFVRVIMSWIQVSPNNKIVRFTNDITEPMLRQIKKMLPRMGMIDLSPLIAFFGISFIQGLLISILG